jgi:hypothetical protein
MGSAALGGTWSGVIGNSNAAGSRHGQPGGIGCEDEQEHERQTKQPNPNPKKKKNTSSEVFFMGTGENRRRTAQSGAIDKPVARLPFRLVRADDVGVGHDNRAVTARQRHAAICGDDRELWLVGRLYKRVARQSAVTRCGRNNNKKRFSMRLTLCRKVLTRLYLADTGKDGGQKAKRREGRQKVGDEFSIGKMGLDSGNAEGGVVRSLSINEGAQERKSEGRCKEKHDG